MFIIIIIIIIIIIFILTIVISGLTEFRILEHLEEIAELSLLLSKFKKPFQDLNTSKTLILNRVTSCQIHVDVN